MLLNKKTTFLILLMISLLTISLLSALSISIAQPGQDKQTKQTKETCDVSEIREALRSALFEFFTSPNDAKFSFDEIKDFLDFYISTDTGQSMVDCSGTGPRSKKAYHQMLGLAKKILKSIPKCSDGTEYGKCSSNGMYCYGGKIVGKCKICGCGENEKCDKSTDNCVPLSAAEIQEKEAHGKPKVKHVKGPKITDIEPSSGAIGAKITLTGSGFTDNNAIFIRGQTVMRGITSLDGSSMEFALPDNTKCLPEQACPIKVVNLNGISNARPFKVTEQIIAPPEPPPEPNITNVTIAPPPVLLAPNITSISPSLGAIGANITLSGSGFTSTGNVVNLAGVNNAVTGLLSSDGVTLKFVMPQTPCEPLKACSVSVTNSRGTSNTAYFTLTQIAPQVNIVQPNGGEKFTQGQNNSISWKGGKDAVQVALAEDSAGSSGSFSDPSSLIVGWINTNSLPDSLINWDAKKVCTLTGDSCWEVAPGSYKALAVSENELGAITINPDGRGNFDISEQPFTIAKPLNPTIAVLEPNGGEKFIRGLNISITWSATDIVSKSVTINLLKAGTFNLRIAANLSLISDTGIFSISWKVPSYLAPATDYSIEILDSANQNVRDASDSSFSMSTGAVVTILAPNGGETWLQGFNGAVFWNMSSYFGTMTFNLLKSGTFYKTLQVSQPTWYYWFEYPYIWARYTLVNVTPDIPVGTDYGVEIVNSYDTTVRDASDAQFKIITLPNPLTVSGRFIDRFTQKPLANSTYFSYYDSNGKYNYTRINSNGEFAFNASTSFEQYWGRSLFSTWPKCYMAMWDGIYKSQLNVYVGHNPFDLPRQYKYLPITSPEMNLGDIPFWPATDIKVQSDIPIQFNLFHSDGLNSAWGYGGYWFQTTSYISNSIPLNLDVWAKLSDEFGKVYYSPPIKLSLDYGCTPKALSFFNGQFKWEPYYIALWNYYYWGTEGKPFYSTPYISGGVKPYNWSIVYGSLPPGLSLSPSNGTISGIPTTAGTYKFTIKAVDSNSVSAAAQQQIQIGTTSGTIPPYIEVLYPMSRYQLYQGYQTTIGWSSYNILSKSVKINLLKGKDFFRNIVQNFSQTWPGGYYYYQWTTPKDIPAGTDYYIEVSDATNSSVRDTNNEPFWFVRTDSGAYWSCCWGPSKYGQWLTFTYPSDVAQVQSFKMYEKRPVNSSFNLIATFPNPSSITNCSSYRAISSNYNWYLTYICGSSSAWQAYTYRFDSSSYPSGEYIYQFTVVDSSGVESAPFATLKQYALEKVTLLNPTSSQSPVNATPIFEWTVPQDWPYGYEKSFYVQVYETVNFSTYSYPYNIYLKYVSPISPVDVYTTKTNYDGAKLDPSKKYLAQVSGIGVSILDNNSLSYVGYIAMSNATNTFWVKP